MATNGLPPEVRRRIRRRTRRVEEDSDGDGEEEGDPPPGTEGPPEGTNPAGPTGGPGTPTTDNDRDVSGGTPLGGDDGSDSGGAGPTEQEIEERVESTPEDPTYPADSDTDDSGGGSQPTDSTSTSTSTTSTTSTTTDRTDSTTSDGSATAGANDGRDGGSDSTEEFVQVEEGEELPEGATREGRLDDPSAQGIEVTPRRAGVGSVAALDDPVAQARTRAALDLEQQLIEETPWLTSAEQVAVRDSADGNGIYTELTPAGYRALEDARRNELAATRQTLREEVAAQSGLYEAEDVETTFEDGTITATVGQEARQDAREQIASERAEVNRDVYQQLAEAGETEAALSLAEGEPTEPLGPIPEGVIRQRQQEVQQARERFRMFQRQQADRDVYQQLVEEGNVTGATALATGDTTPFAEDRREFEDALSEFRQGVTFGDAAGASVERTATEEERLSSSQAVARNLLTLTPTQEEREIGQVTALAGNLQQPETLDKRPAPTPQLSLAVEDFEDTTGIDVPGEGPVAMLSPDRGDAFGSGGEVFGGPGGRFEEAFEELSTAGTRLGRQNGRRGGTAISAPAVMATLFSTALPGLPNVSTDTRQRTREAGRGLGAGVGEGTVGFVASIPDRLDEVSETGVAFSEATFNQVTGSGPGLGAFGQDATGAALLRGAQAGEFALENPVRFTGQLAGSSVLVGGAVGGAGRLAGPRAGTAVDYLTQPGEAAVRTAVRRGTVPERLGTLAPGVRGGQFSGGDAGGAGLRTRVGESVADFQTQVADVAPNVGIETDVDAPLFDVNTNLRERLPSELTGARREGDFGVFAGEDSELELADRARAFRQDLGVRVEDARQGLREQAFLFNENPPGLADARLNAQDFGVFAEGPGLDRFTDRIRGFRQDLGVRAADARQGLREQAFLFNQNPRGFADARQEGRDFGVFTDGPGFGDVADRARAFRQDLGVRATGVSQGLQEEAFLFNENPRGVADARLEGRDFGVFAEGPGLDRFADRARAFRQDLGVRVEDARQGLGEEAFLINENLRGVADHGQEGRDFGVFADAASARDLADRALAGRQDLGARFEDFRRGLREEAFLFNQNPRGFADARQEGQPFGVFVDGPGLDVFDELTFRVGDPQARTPDGGDADPADATVFDDILGERDPDAGDETQLRGDDERDVDEERPAAGGEDQVLVGRQREQTETTDTPEERTGAGTDAVFREEATMLVDEVDADEAMTFDDLLGGGDENAGGDVSPDDVRTLDDMGGTLGEQASVEEVDPQGADEQLIRPLDDDGAWLGEGLSGEITVEVTGEVTAEEAQGQPEPVRFDGLTGEPIFEDDQVDDTLDDDLDISTWSTGEATTDSPAELSPGEPDDPRRPREGGVDFEGEGGFRGDRRAFEALVSYFSTGIPRAAELFSTGDGEGVFGRDVDARDGEAAADRSGRRRRRGRRRGGRGGLYGGESDDVFGGDESEGLFEGAEYDGVFAEPQDASEGRGRQRREEDRGLFGGDSEDVFGGADDDGLFGDDDGIF